MLDLHVHLLGHLDRKVTKAAVREFLNAAVEKGISYIGFADHDLYWEHFNFSLVRQVGEEYPELQVRIGLEVDYREDREEEIAAMLQACPFDYVIGSVHQIGDWLFDYPEEEKNHHKRDADKLYKEYFAIVEKAAKSGLFDIIGHFDLIKLFGVRPQTDVRLLAAPALEAIKEAGLVVEVNTNGRYKPVQEFYPEYKLLELIKELGIPVTLGSDAHHPGAVGRDISEACLTLQSLGVKEINFFSGRKSIQLPLAF
ncbi:MAG TPA: histidinol-phosphatase HisJ family protein [Peptococcaceae bacterium]|nr:histidinol-phosphatase HisJ family protein [Peptococcaceae bacterium]